MSIDAMKLALEALESNQPVNYCENAYGERSPIFLSNPLRFEINAKAIAALRQAIKDEEEAFRPDYDTNAVLLERIRELEQAEKQEPVAWLCCPPGKCAYRQIHKTENCPRENLPADTAPMSTKHEKIDTKSERVDPVNIEPVGKVIQALQPTGWTGKVMMKKIVQFDQTLPVGTKLYTAPPKREWKSLTDNEIIFIENSTPSRSYNDHARAIEQRLKEKNND